MNEQFTSDIIPVHCFFCGERGEVFAGTLADDEEYICDMCFDAYQDLRRGKPYDRQADSKDADQEFRRDTGQGI